MVLHVKSIHVIIQWTCMYMFYTCNLNIGLSLHVVFNLIVHVLVCFNFLYQCNYGILMCHYAITCTFCKQLVSVQVHVHIICMYNIHVITGIFFSVKENYQKLSKWNRKFSLSFSDLKPLLFLAHLAS